MGGRARVGVEHVSNVLPRDAAADAAGHVRFAVNQFRPRHRSLRSASADRRAGENIRFHDQNISRDPSVSIGFRSGRRLRRNSIGDQHGGRAALRAAHTQGRALCNCDRQRIPSAGDRFGKLEVFYSGGFVSDIFLGRYSARFCFALVVFHSLLRRAVPRADGKDDLRQLSVHH